MWRRNAAVRPLTKGEEQQALAVCATDPVRHTYPAARVLEFGVETRPSNLLGWYPRGRLEAVCWTNANIVPVVTTPGGLDAMADRLVSQRFRASSIFGDAKDTVRLHQLLGWNAREVRDDQPLMAVRSLPSEVGIAVDKQVRRARMDELDAVLPASYAMFTEELGTPPYTGSDVWYRQAVGGLIARGHTFVRVEEGKVIFKADVGSLALGVAQIQGVWVDPTRRGEGLGARGMAAVVEHVLRELAPTASLYVNGYNHAALATYRRVGFSQVGQFATVLL